MESYMFRLPPCCFNVILVRELENEEEKNILQCLVYYVLATLACKRPTIIYIGIEIRNISSRNMISNWNV